MNWNKVFEYYEGNLLRKYSKDPSVLSELLKNCMANLQILYNNHFIRHKASDFV